MANFLLSHALTARNEGGYANNPADRGGETHLGISRKSFPDWVGWAGVDALKKKPGFPGTANSSAALKQQAEMLYKSAFWNVLRLDFFTSQPLANAVYDFGVNAGTVRAAAILQQACNLLTTTEIDTDGKIGPATIAAVNSVKSQALLLKTFAILRGEFYLDIAKRNPSQKVFVASWLSRISLA